MTHGGASQYFRARDLRCRAVRRVFPVLLGALALLSSERPPRRGRWPRRPDDHHHDAARDHDYDDSAGVGHHVDDGIDVDDDDHRALDFDDRGRRRTARPTAARGPGSDPRAGLAGRRPARLTGRVEVPR